MYVPRAERIIMNFSLLLGAVCLVSSAVAQQYVSQGPVPQRPPAFAGATLVQPARQAVRQRPVARTFEEPTLPRRTQASQAAQQQVIRQRRPQPVARARNLIQEDRPQQARSRISSGEVEDVYLKQRTVTAPLPTPAPLPQTTRVIAPSPKPVIEEDEYYEDDEEEGTTPASISRSSYVGPFTPSQPPTPFQLQRPLPQQQQQQSQPQSFQRPTYLQPSAFRPSAQINTQQQPQQQQQQPNIVRQFPRPQPQQIRPQPPVSPPVTRPPPAISPIQNLASSEDEEDEPQYFRQTVRQQQKRPLPQQQEPEPYRQPQSKPAPARQQVIRQPETSRPYPSKASTSQKEKKPVVQTLKKYHEENEDGSITWGYENDDGTFKEETIGVDCVTHGKYGYYDPDGVKREYTYQTGIPCDREAEAQEAASNNEGYIDYTSNKYVFPNGEEIDLDAMVKNRARKPIGKYRN